MLFIAAAGNEGSDNDQLPHYPSNYPTANIVSVASTTKTGSLSSFSCYGKETVDVAAPGSSIYSTVPKNKYASLSGTSMATPHVSGLAALIWLHRPGLTMPQVKQIIMDSSTPVDALQNSSLTDGRINARRALLLASSYDATYPPVHQPQAIAFADADPEVGRIGGIATVTAAADESDITYYSLHFISVAGFLMEQVGTVNKTGKETLSVELVNLTIPKYVTGLAVVAANQSAKAGPGKAAVVEIKDYGVPKYGPGKGFWGGDVDGRGGYVAGSIKFERAVSEKTITHYNLYWKDAGGSFLGKVPAAGFKTPSCEGDCDLLDMNFSGGVYTYSRGPYTNNEMAMISFSGPATVTVTKFMTEKYYDHLEVGGEQLTGTRLVLPRRIELESGPQKIVWSTDRSEVESGWSLELVQTGTVGEYALPSVQPPSWEVEIKASYSDTEGELASVATLSDFDAETMPPSAALTPRELRFLDLHTEQHMIQGSIEFLSPLNCSGSITDYEVIFANAEGKAVDGFQWKLTAPTNCSALLQVPVEAMTVPSAATQVIVTPENKNGKGLAASIPLLDVVRSLPINATFTGDRDPARNQVKGGVRITPAENPTGITAYAVYFLNGTEKAKLLGRVASALDEPVVYEFHVIVKPSQRSLLVVSVYEDAEMDEGVTLEFTDFVEEEPEPNMPGRFLAEQQTLDLEPWLRRPRQPAWNEVQLLWTDQGKEADAQSKKSVEIRSDRRVMGVLTIPGVLSSTSSTSGSGQTGQTFVPPSFETRKTLVSALAESLPAVSREQLRLTKGQMQTCQVALGSKGLRQVPNGACLVVHFEVLPDATLAVHAKYLQDFLDRVEARLIALSRGSSAAEKLNRLLTKRLSDSGAIALPPGGVWAVVGEPQQVAPKVRSGGRALATSGLSQQTVSGVWDEELESEQETSPVMLAVSVGAVLGAISAAGIAAMRFASRKREPLASAASVNPVPADAAAAIDVNVQHD